MCVRARVRVCWWFSEGDASQEDRQIISLMNPESAYAVENKKVITDCILCHLEHLAGNLHRHSNLSLATDCAHRHTHTTSRLPEFYVLSFGRESGRNGG